MNDTATRDHVATASHRNAHVADAPRARVLISTFPYDITSVTVSLALEQIGCDVQRWMQADFPTQQAVSFAISNASQAQTHAHGVAIERDLSAIDVAWHRRLSLPRIPADALHPDDLKVARSEAKLFFDNLMPLVAPHARHINPRGGELRADNKLLQLQQARALGLAIPDTLVSNDPARIREFVRRHQSHGVVHKTIGGHYYVEEDGIRVCHTGRVLLDDLPESSVLQALPAIFQAAVPKACEVRATFFGSAYLAAAIDTSSGSEIDQDWRNIPPAQMRWIPHVLPEPVADRIRALMRSLNLVFGSVDLIVTPTGDYVFLEVNPQGQFLWLDRLTDGALPMLDAFVRFVIEGEGYQHRRRTFAPIRLPTEHTPEHLERIAHDERAHVICKNYQGQLRMG